MKGNIYTLTDTELAEAEHYAQIRQGCKDESQGGRESEEHTDLDCHFIGLKGEIALAAWLGNDFDRTEKKHGDDGVDNVYMGYRISVQTRSKYHHDAVYFHSPKIMKCHYFFLCVMHDERDLEMRCWFSKMDWKKKETWQFNKRNQVIHCRDGKSWDEWPVKHQEMWG